MRQFLLAALFVCQSAAAELCDGKYAATAALVDRTLNQYGTLYSGGDHWHNIDSIALTADMYRLWRGLPDWQLRELRVSEDFEPDYGQGAEPARSWQWIGDASDGALWTDQQKADAVANLDLNATPSRPADTWFVSGAPANPFIDWLQFTLEASNAPWAIASYLEHSNYDKQPYLNLRDEALRRFKTNEGIEWAVVSLLISPPDQLSPELKGVFGQWRHQVHTCKASQAVFAAWAVSAPAVWTGRLALSQPLKWVNLYDQAQELPDSTRGIVVRNLTRETILASLTSGSIDEVGIALGPVAHRLENSPLKSWVNVGLTFGASTIEQLSAIHQGQKLDGYTVRALNLLSVKDLAYFANHTALSTIDYQALISVAFARNVALGNNSAAFELIDELRNIWPANASRINEILQTDMPLETKLAAIVLDNPELSTWLKGDAPDYAIWLRNQRTRRDLPLEIAAGAAFQDDLETWMLAPQRWTRFGGMHGIMIPALDRLYASNGRRTQPDSFDIPSLFNRSPSARPRGFQRLVCWSEIAELAGSSGLSNRVSISIIEWARDRSRNWLVRLVVPQEPVADLLSKVVKLNRYNDGGWLNGERVGKVAFELLHRRFAKTPAAIQTPYWYQ